MCTIPSPGRWFYSRSHPPLCQDTQLRPEDGNNTTTHHNMCIVEFISTLAPHHSTKTPPPPNSAPQKGSYHATTAHRRTGTCKRTYKHVASLAYSLHPRVSCPACVGWGYGYAYLYGPHDCRGAEGGGRDERHADIRRRDHHRGLSNLEVEV